MGSITGLALYSPSSLRALSGHLLTLRKTSSDVVFICSPRIESIASILSLDGLSAIDLGCKRDATLFLSTCWVVGLLPGLKSEIRISM